VLATAVTHIVNAVNKLRTHGAQHIVVLGLPDLGKIPISIDNNSAALMSYLTTSFNNNLATALKPPNVIYINMQTALDMVTDSQTIMPSFIKLSNFTERCFDAKTLTTCNEPEHYLFWDEQHPITVGHQLIALVIYDEQKQSFSQTFAHVFIIIILYHLSLK
jgi:outer membrane lipase/esterase